MVKKKKGLREILAEQYSEMEKKARNLEAELRKKEKEDGKPNSVDPVLVHGFIPVAAETGSGKSHSMYARIVQDLLENRENLAKAKKYVITTPRKNNLDEKGLSKIYNSDDEWEEVRNQKDAAWLDDQVLMLDGDVSLINRLFSGLYAKDKKSSDYISARSLKEDIGKTLITTNDSSYELSQCSEYVDFFKTFKRYFFSGKDKIYEDLLHQAYKRFRSFCLERYKSEEKFLHGEEIERIRKTAKKEEWSSETMYKLMRTKRLEWLKENGDWEWVFKLFPGVLYYDKKVIMLSTNKLYFRINTFLFRSIDLMTDSEMDGQIYFMDEFDSVQTVLEDQILSEIEKRRVNKIKLLRQLSMCDQLQFSEDFLLGNSEKIQREFRSIQEKIKSVVDKFQLYARYKTLEVQGEAMCRYMFFDGEYIAVQDRDAKKIYVVLKDPDSNFGVNYLAFGDEQRDACILKSGMDPESLTEEQKKRVVLLKDVLREVDKVLRKFFWFVVHHLQAEFENRKKLPAGSVDVVLQTSREDHVESVLQVFELKEEQLLYCRDVILELLQDLQNIRRVNRFKSEDQKEPEEENRNLFRYYERGFSIYQFTDTSTDKYETNILTMSALRTPETLLAAMAEHAVVFGISATANIKSVLSNFSLPYMEYRLGDFYHEITEEEKRDFVEAYQSDNNNYGADGEIQIDVVPVFGSVKGSTELKKGINAAWMLPFEKTPEAVGFLSKVFPAKDPVVKDAEGKVKVDEIGISRLIQFAQCARFLLEEDPKSCHSMLLMFNSKAKTFNQQRMNHFKEFRWRVSDQGVSLTYCYENIVLITYMLMLQKEGKLKDFLDQHHHDFENLALPAEEVQDAVKRLGFLFKDGSEADFDQSKKYVDGLLTDKDIDHVLVFTTKGSAGSGVNLHYENDERFPDLVCKNKQGNYYTNLYKDYDSLYLANPTFIIALPDKKPERWIIPDVIKLLAQIEKLYSSKSIVNIYKKQLILDIINGMSDPRFQEDLHLRLNGLMLSKWLVDKGVKSIYKCQDVFDAKIQSVIQSAGRIDRTYFKQSRICVFIESDLLKVDVSNYILEQTASPLMKGILQQLRDGYSEHPELEEGERSRLIQELKKHYPAKVDLVKRSDETESFESYEQDGIEKSNQLTQIIQEKLKAINSNPVTDRGRKKKQKAIRDWEKMRLAALANLWLTEEDFIQFCQNHKNQGWANALYFRVPNVPERIFYQKSGLSEEVVKLSFHNFAGSMCQDLKHFEKFFSGLSGLQKRIEEKVKEFRYQSAVDDSNDPNPMYVLNPTAFVNIYLGAVGEEAARYFFEEIMHEKVDDLQDDAYEKMDFSLVDRHVAIDAKNYSAVTVTQIGTKKDNDKLFDKYKKKLSACGMKKGIVVNTRSIMNLQNEGFDNKFTIQRDEEGYEVMYIEKLFSRDGKAYVDVKRAVEKFIG